MYSTVLSFVGLKRWVNRRQSASLGTWICAKSLLPICASSDMRRACRKRIWRYEADVNRSYMSKLEKGGSYVGLEIIGKLAAVLQVEPAELLRLPPRKGARRG